MAGLILLILLAPASAQATFPGENGPIVFESLDVEALQSSIYLVRPDGSGLKRLTTPDVGESDNRPSFSPDGRKIAYTHDEPGPSVGGVNRTQVRLMNLDGTGDVQVTNSAIGSHQPSFSPDGQKIVFIQASLGQPDSINTINVDGTGFTQLHSDIVVMYPAYSPDGSRIAFFGPGGQWLMNADGSDPHLIVPDAGRASWSPDGTRIASYTFPPGTPEDPGLGGIHTFKPDGTDQVNEVPIVFPDLPEQAAYSPDGESLVYSNQIFNSTPTAPSRWSIRIHALADGNSAPVLADLPQIEQVDWGVYTRTCESDEAFCPPEPPAPECKVRFVRPRFFVFRGKPAYRLVAKYYSEDPAEVQIEFFSRTKNGGKGSSLGTLTKELSGYGSRFRVTKKVSRKRIKPIRRSKNGFIAQFRVVPDQGSCPVSVSYELTKRTVVKKHFVWFLNDF